MVIIDTNIIIDHLRQHQKISLLQQLKKTDPDIALSLISIQELFTGQSTKKTKNTNILLSLINSFEILPYDYQIAKNAGTINRDLKNPIAFADTTLAATAICYRCPLFTLNQKHFKNIPKLQLFKIPKITV